MGKRTGMWELKFGELWDLDPGELQSLEDASPKKGEKKIVSKGKGKPNAHQKSAIDPFVESAEEESESDEEGEYEAEAGSDHVCVHSLERKSWLISDARSLKATNKKKINDRMMMARSRVYPLHLIQKTKWLHRESGSCQRARLCQNQINGSSYLLLHRKGTNSS